jgi:hypothetical protein
MKNTMTLTLIAAAFAACTVFEPEPKIELTSYSIIEGDTVKTRIEKDFKEYKKHDANARNFIIVGDTVLTYKEPKLHTPPAKAPDLSKLKNNDDPDLKGKPLRMVAIGGSLTAGVRDGGYFNEGMLTSYPNLIARQMGIKFEQPLFDADSYNGYGRKVRTSFNPTGGPVPKFKEVSNNSGVEGFISLGNEKGNDRIRLKPTKNVNIDNWSFPDLENGFLFSTVQVKEIENIGSYDVEYSKKNNLKASFINRVNPDKNKSIVANAFEKKGDIFLIEYGYADIIKYINNENMSNSFLGGIDFLKYPFDYVTKTPMVDPLTVLYPMKN